MKILLIRMYPTKMTTNNYNVQELGLAKSLRKKGYICDVVSYNASDETYIKKIEIGKGYNPIINYCVNGKNILKNCFFNPVIYELINKYDIVQTEEYDQLQNVQLLKKINKPLYIYHGPYYNKFNLYNLKYYLKTIIYDLFFLNNPNYKKVLVFSKSKLAESFLKKKKFKNIKTVGVGIDLDKFKINTCTNEKIDLLIRNKENSKYVLYVGKLEPRRNVIFLIKLFRKIHFHDNNIKLIIVGNGKRKYKDKCFKLINKYHLKESVIYYEAFNQEDLPFLYQCCDLFILPTNYEIFGMVILEAMYFKLPVVTTLNGGSSTIIENGTNGFILDKNKIDNWVKIIEKILNDDKLRNKIAYSAYKTIIENYTWDKIADKFIEEYKKYM